MLDRVDVKAETECAKCGAKQGESCRTAQGRATHFHVIRIVAAGRLWAEGKNKTTPKRFDESL